MENQNDKTMALLAYIIFFIPLVAVENRSSFLNFHTNQGLSLFLVAVVGFFIFNFIPIPYLTGVWNLTILILAIMGIINASNGEMKPLPIIGNLFKII